jgi:very-short-patch-repair endonuclease
MQTGANGEAATQSAPMISADFLTGSTEIGLDRIRTRLLDLTNRNKLLNFRHSNVSSLRVVDVPLDSVFVRLLGEEKLPFLPVPEPGIHLKEGTTPKDYAEELGWNTSFDLDEIENQESQHLPVLHYQEPLDTITRKIASAAKTAVEESGANMLYLIFGFLEWYESDDSNQPRLAPLVVVPVTIDRAGGKGKAVETVLEYSGEDVETNLSLIEKMRRDFGLELPLLDDEDTPETYFAKYREILAIKKRWKLRRHITLSLLSFGKLLMYRDLDPKTWPASKNIAKHPLVKELFEGTKHPNIDLAEEFPIDAPELKKDVPYLILDADSSQHSALIHALRGQNLVIEGPPGTGKSQTITNLIAAALTRGKTVLFVAEKLAALEVVRKRLDDVGLGVFCLEVHSHKTKKGALLGDLAQRYGMRGTFQDPRDLDRHLSVIEQKKQLLTQYASLINRVVEPFGVSIFEILWARERCGQEISSHREGLGQLILPGLVLFTQLQFTQAEQFLSVYAQHLSAVLSSCDSLDEHPWAWIQGPQGFEEEERLLAAMDVFRATVRRAEQCYEHLRSNGGITLGSSTRGMEEAAQILAHLPEPGGPLLETLLAPCQTSAMRQRLEDFVGEIEIHRRSYQSLSSFTTRPNALLNDDADKVLSGAFQCCREWGLEADTVVEVRRLYTMASEGAQLIAEAHSSFRFLLDLIGCDAPASFPTSALLLEMLRVIEAAPMERLHLREPIFEDERTKHLLHAAKKEATSLRDEEVTLSREFDLSLGAGAHTPAYLLKCAAILEYASLWERLVGREYRCAVRTYRQVSRQPLRVHREQMSRSLRSVAQYAQRRSEFDCNDSYRQGLGAAFVGVHSSWDALQELLQWYEDVFVALPEHQLQAQPFRRLALTARVERLGSIKANLPRAEEHRALLRDVTARITDLFRSLPTQRPLSVYGSFDEVQACLQKLARDLSAVLQGIEVLGIHEDASLQEFPRFQTIVLDCRKAKSRFESATDLHEQLAETYRGAETELEPIKRTVKFATLIASGSLPSKSVEWLLSADYVRRLEELRLWLSRTSDCGSTLRDTAQTLESLSGSSAWSTQSPQSWGSLVALIERSLSSPQGLDQWNHFLRVQIKSKEAGLHRLTALAETKKLEPGELGRAFHFVFYNTLARSTFTQYTDLAQVTGLTQEELRKQFAASDKEAIRLYSERVASVTDKRELFYGNQSGPVKTWTELALIVHETNKQKRHIPIRQLMSRAPNALLSLKPCFMMGPLSVAQYLEPGRMKFDLVVMDEASQLKPEDAIGALARGGQVVIVGDPKQLPPTNFFQRVSLDPDDADEDERTAVEEGESILDVASTLFQPVRRLRWHYRSRHHSLIAFSNEEFYDRDLIIFPTAYHDDPSLGVKHQFVPDGIFEGSRNAREAAVVVAAVMEHMRHNPHESLGVVTLNFEQRELVEELLDRKLRDDPAAIAYQERMKGGQETLFVKNLENVQGDERDVIFISTTYGPDARGNQYQRFGPINGPSGHRRLNVLFTRAKKRVVVFSSLDPDRIQTTANSPWGVRALKQYLTFARTGILEQADDGSDQPTNDFERSVGTVLKENGYEVIPQVGVAGFFIDLGVKHPAKAGTYLLGIECDGASYHSGRSARDRDRLRQEILENLGWKIHRIWSTDWFRNRDAEIKRLTCRIDELLRSDPAYQKQQDKVNRVEILRQRLITFRESELKPAFPDSPPERGLLRKSLLEEFLEKRPKTRAQWFQRFPESTRTSIDSKQVSQFLDRVLEIIVECDS